MNDLVAKCHHARSRRMSSVALAALAVFSTPAISQQIGPSGSTGASSPRGFDVDASASVTVTSISSSAVSAGTLGVGADPLLALGGTGDTVLQVSPTLNISANTARIRGSLRYALNAYRYQEQEQANRVAHSIEGRGSLEAIEDSAFVDVSLRRAEQAQSAFATPILTSVLPTANRVEVTNASISPYLTGRLLQSVDLLARYTHAVSDTSTASGVSAVQAVTPALGRLTTDSLDLRASGGGILGWSLAYQDARRGYNLGRSIETSRADAVVTYRPDVDWQLRAGIGVEENNVLATSLQRYSTALVGVRWTPSPRTTAEAEASDRFFGRGHRFVLQHQMARTVIRLSDSRDVASQLGGASARPGEPTTLLEELLRSNTLRGSGTAAEREQLILDGLRRAGIDPAQSLTAGSLNATPSAVRRQELFLGYSGLRLSASVSAFTSTARRLGSPLNPFEDLALAPEVRQRGATAAIGWRLSPTSALNLNVRGIQTPATGVLASVEQRAAGVGYSTTVGRQSNLALNLQRVEFSNGAAAGRAALQRESNVVSATFNMRF